MCKMLEQYGGQCSNIRGEQQMEFRMHHSYRLVLPMLNRMLQLVEGNGAYYIHVME